VEQLGGGEFAQGRPSPGSPWYGDLRGVFPNSDGYSAGRADSPARPQWEPPGRAQGHIDGYGGANSWRGGLLLGATVYLNDVAPTGGALFVWPGSHAAIHRYFRASPGAIDGRYICEEDWPGGVQNKMYADDRTVVRFTNRSGVHVG
jgi:hypothetical protein